MTNKDPAGANDADLIVVLGDSAEPPPTVPPARPAPPSSYPYPPPEDRAPEWWVAMSFEADDEEPERIGRLPGPGEEPGPVRTDPAARRTFGMLTLAAFLSILVFAGVLTHFVG